MTKAKLASSFAIIVLLVACMILSCSRGTPPASVDVDLGEIGTWTWVESTGGILGCTIYADSVDYTRGLIFDSDSNYVYTRDGQIESSGMYLKSFETPPSGSSPVWVVKYTDALISSDVIVRVDADTLILAQTVLDGYISTFARSLD